jgi:hypothetical protein
MMANSVELPSLMLEEGQYRAKQVDHNLPGVCNEHVPSTEVKMCSELHRNV